MRLKNIQELFTLKGLFSSIVMMLFGYAVGFLAGWIVEKFHDKEGTKMPFIDLSIPNTAGLLLGVGGWIYMVWLLFEKSRQERKGTEKV